MAAFVRLDNQLIRRRAEGIEHPDDVGLFALLSAFLSIPDFRTPGGGLHAAIAKHCSNGRHTRNAAWQRLSRAGYLKRTRLPDSKFRLRDLYTLQLTPDLSSPAVSHVGFAQARQLWDSHTSFLPPTANFTPVSTAVLMDPRLSLSAKGLYALIRQRLLLSRRVSGMTLSRESLRRSSGMGECAFRRIWRELRDTGYLSLSHVYDAEQKKMLYRYDLAETLDQTAAVEETDDLTALQSEQPRQVAKELTLPHFSTEATPNTIEPRVSTADVHMDPELKETVREQIEYDVLLARNNPRPLLDCAVEIMTRLLRTPPEQSLTIRGARYSAAEVQRTLRELDANEAEYAVQALSRAVDTANRRGTPIQNIRAYLLSCLFTAKTDFATSLI